MSIETMSAAIEYVEEHLRESIGVADIADAVRYSLYHFCRVFKQIVHHTPYDYLMRRRLSESARALVETDQKIIDIAFDYQFNSPETYSRAFKRMFGIQPTQLRKRGSFDARLLMPRLSAAYLRHIDRGGYLRPILEAKGAFHVAGLMAPIGQDRMLIPQLQDMAARELKDITDRGQSARHYGITYHPIDWETCGRLYYMAGIGIDQVEVAGPGLVVKTLPAAQYARFVHKGRLKDVQFTLDYVYHTWLPKSGCRLDYPLEIEYHGGTFGHLDDDEAETEIWIPIRSQDKTTNKGGNYGTRWRI